MAGTHSKLQEYKMDGLDGALDTFTTALFGSGVSFDRDVNMLDTTTAGDGSETSIPGLKNANIAVEIEYDATLIASVDDVYAAGGTTAGTSLSFEYYPAGNTTGNRKYIGEGYVTSPAVSSAVGDLIKYSFSFKVSGDVTGSTV